MHEQKRVHDLSDLQSLFSRSTHSDAADRLDNSARVVRISESQTFQQLFAHPAEPAKPWGKLVGPDVRVRVFEHLRSGLQRVLNSTSNQDSRIDTDRTTEPQPTESGNQPQSFKGK